MCLPHPANALPHLALSHPELSRSLFAENGTPFTVSGTGKPLRQFIYSRDLAKLFVWMLFSYQEIDPVILSVGEADEISIKDVADSIVKHVGFNGEYTVSGCFGCEAACLASYLV